MADRLTGADLAVLRGKRPLPVLWGEVPDEAAARVQLA
jgi:hypothetical protein